MKVLLAVDASPSACDVVKEAAARPWPVGTSFHLVHVVDTFLYPDVPMMVQTVDRAGAELLGRVAAELKHSIRNVTTEVLHGIPRQMILESAEKLGADLILIGSHGLGGFARFFLGSTARDVLRKALCSVEVVRGIAAGQTPRFGGPMKVLMATDGSELSMRAVQSVARSLWPAGTTFRAIAVPEFVVTYMAPDYLTNELVSDLRTNSMTQSREALVRALDTLKRAGHTADGIVPGDGESPVAAIVREAEAWGANLVVVGSHGRRGFDRFVLGSVAEAVALRAYCSVEIYRGDGASRI
jgi:nucleotide-binding universal stress UspA family protein